MTAQTRWVPAEIEVVAQRGFVRRRWVQSLGIAAVLVLAAAVPAAAIFSVSRSTQTTVATAAVPQPTNVTVTKNWCHPVHSTSFTVSWQPGSPHGSRSALASPDHCADLYALDSAVGSISGPRLLTVPQPPRVADLVSWHRGRRLSGAPHAVPTAALSVAGFTVRAERGCAVGGPTMIVAADWFDRVGYVALAIGIPSDCSSCGWSSAS